MDRLILGALAVLSFGACGSSPTVSDAGAESLQGDAAEPGRDATVSGGMDALAPSPDAGPVDLPPAVEIAGLAPLAKVHGAFPIQVKATDDLGLARIELFVGDATTPAASKTLKAGGPDTNTVYLSTTKISEGVATIWARAVDTAGQATDTAKIPVVVCNLGQEIKLEEGTLGTIDVPANYDPAKPTVEVDQKHHWDNPDGIHRIVGTLAWTTASGDNKWELGLLVGSGECPDNGATLCDEAVSATSPLFVDAAIQGADVTPGLHFLHVRPANVLAHRGTTQAYEVHVYLWP